MLRLLFLYLFLAFSLFTFGQKSIKEHAFKTFYQSQNSCDTIEIKNSSLNTDDWVKDQVGTTTSFEGQLLDLSNGVKSKNFTFYNTAIKVKKADGIVFYFKDFIIPKGGVLYIKGVHSNSFITYNHTDNLDGGIFVTHLISDQAISIVYQQLNGTPLPNLAVSEVGITNKQTKYRRKKAFGAAGDCLININCSEGNDWQDEKRSAVRILTKVAGKLLTCSGTIMNNTAEDFTPYILTAEHCANQAGTNNYSTPEELDSWIFYFNYESDNCANPSGESEVNFKTMTGATFVAQSHDMGGDKGSDFYLVKLKQNIPANYCAFYSGWNRENKPAQSGVSIHHPKFDIKKISTFNSPPTSDESIDGVLDTYWKLQWGPTTNGHSVTEGGSSGGALFDQNKYLVGTLNGGNASCSNKQGHDWYGKFSYHWASNGATSDRQLKSHLDPLNTGVTTLNGIGSISTPQIQITASHNNVCDNQTINFSITSEQNQGSSPSYDWYINNILSASTRTFSSNQLKNNDVIKVVLHSSLDCVTTQSKSSNEITMSLLPTFETAIKINTNSKELCTGESATFTIQEQAGTGTYKWFLNDTLTVLTNTYTSDTLETKDIITAIITSTENCKTSDEAISNEVVMTVEDAITPSINIDLYNNSFPICENTPVTITATTFGIGQTGSIEWFKNETHEGNGLTKSFSSLHQKDSIRATLNSSLECATIIEVYSDTIKAEINFCTGITPSEDTPLATVYPNPVSNTLHINGNDITKVSIINTIGQTVLTSNSQKTINCESLPSGVYIVIIHRDKDQFIQQIIKN